MGFSRGLKNFDALGWGIPDILKTPRPIYVTTPGSSTTLV